MRTHTRVEGVAPGLLRVEIVQVKEVAKRRCDD